MGLTDRMGEVGMVERSLAFWGLGQVGVAIYSVSERRLSSVRNTFQIVSSSRSSNRPARSDAASSRAVCKSAR
jgi:hypothetical protein